MSKKKLVTLIAAVLIIAAAVIILVVFLTEEDEASLPTPAPVDNPIASSIPAKPVIYLYPTEKTDITVTLEYNGVLDCTYPAYNGGWSVTAYPDGTIINHSDNREYSYLFWEGHGEAEYDFSSGFVVAGDKTEEFLQKKLEQIGLTPKEYNEFIVYWLPQMKDNEFNLIAFQQEAYTKNAPLIISPAPDSMLRVFMVYKSLNEPIEIPPQNIDTFVRAGFTVVEWGGSEVK